MEGLGGLFTCDIHRMRLTPETCAAFWRKGRALPPKSFDTAAKCRGCGIGARNAGESPETSVAADPLDARCCRCGRVAGKVLYGRICVSCYNRQREVEVGRNARGNAPTRLAPLRPYAAAVLPAAGTELQIKKIDAVASGAEALSALVRRQSLETLIAWDGSTQVLDD